MTFKTKFATLLGAAVLAFTTPLAAQQTQPAQPVEIAPEDVTDSQVEAFVEAILAVEEVRDTYTPRIDAAEDEAAQQNLVEEANEAALSAVGEVENMDIDSYIAIANAASENDVLNQRIIARITEMREE